MGSESSPQPSNEMLSFNATASVLTPRLGRLAFAGRKPISTPHYIPLASRGVVPHIAHDVLRDHTDIGSLYVGLEDCMPFSSCSEVESALTRMPIGAQISRRKTKPKTSASGLYHSHRTR